MAEKRIKAPLREILAILRKYRNRGSIVFLIKWVRFKKPQPEKHNLVPFFLQFAGLWDRNTQELYYIYHGLKVETNSLVALSGVAEIVQAAEVAITKDKEIRTQKKLKKIYGDMIPAHLFRSPEERQHDLDKIKHQRRERRREKEQKKRDDKDVARRRLSSIQLIRRERDDG